MQHVKMTHNIMMKEILIIIFLKFQLRKPENKHQTSVTGEQTIVESPNINNVHFPLLFSPTKVETTYVNAIRANLGGVKADSQSNFCRFCSSLSAHVYERDAETKRNQSSLDLLTM